MGTAQDKERQEEERKKLERERVQREKQGQTPGKPETDNDPDNPANQSPPTPPYQKP